MFGIEKKVAQTAKRAGLLSGGLLLCSVGVGFLTVAGWFALVPLLGTQNTALILAGVYVGIGLIMIGVGSHRSARRSDASMARTQAQAATAPPIVEAFMYGLQAGARADQARHSPAHQGSSSL
ncbi:phage holin family protein [uncultured Tateyamaria sp.]|uniref:phage holin family protein n=1 Tax=uncultured Tateyamaria sp. TaxID=455651 RepID=UPI00261958DB|nr:phage holin family protein [uncultured Tateyamaria sp.]